jgi:hypothetical protein
MAMLPGLMAAMKAAAAGAAVNEAMDASASATLAQCTITSQVAFSPGADSRAMKPGLQRDVFTLHGFVELREMIYGNAVPDSQGDDLDHRIDCHADPSKMRRERLAAPPCS